MNVLNHIISHGIRNPHKKAYINGEKQITYGELNDRSDRLAAYLLDHCPEKSPLVVFGHKDPMMVVSFLACVKSGRAYCPVDTNVPMDRAAQIIEAVNGPVVLATEPLDAQIPGLLDLERLQDISANYGKKESLPYINGSDVYYIIFTSGSTGKPKGVQITADCLDNFVAWGHTLGDPSAHCPDAVYINQAPFSFDLSVMDLYLSLDAGATLWALEKSIQGRAKDLYASLSASGATVWVSTPSFAEVCLCDPMFAEALMPQMRVFLFCGETLPNATVKKLHERFPKALVVNTYGPTESTVAVTEITVTPEIAKNISPLPVGKSKPGTEILIVDEAGNVLPPYERGEIIIVGNTVSIGYFSNLEQTAKAFFTRPFDDVEVRAYHTGDKGYIDEDGNVFYCGRIDLQIKLHGYRIEIEDIENNLMRLDEISAVAVVPIQRGSEYKSLTAFAIPNVPVEDSFAFSLQIKAKLKELVPEYMIPKKFIFVSSLPMTTNGKVNRKELREMVK